MTPLREVGFVLENSSADEEVDSLKLLNASIALAFAQIQEARRHVGLLSPRAMVALATLMKRGMEACRERAELEKAEQERAASSTEERARRVAS